MASGALVLLAVCITIATPDNSDQTKNVPRVEEDHLIIKSFLSLAPTPYQSGCNFGPIWQKLSSPQQVFSYDLENISLKVFFQAFWVFFFDSNEDKQVTCPEISEKVWVLIKMVFDGLDRNQDGGLQLDNNWNYLVE